MKKRNKNAPVFRIGNALVAVDHYTSTETPGPFYIFTVTRDEDGITFQYRFNPKAVPTGLDGEVLARYLLEHAADAKFMRHWKEE